MLRLIFLILPFGLFGQSFEVVRVISVYDGDTFRVDLNCNIDFFCKNRSIRVNGVDTPEILGKCSEEKALAKRAREFTKSFLSKGDITLINAECDFYCRIVADVYVDGQLLSEELISQKLGRYYSGKQKRQSWCE